MTDVRPFPHCELHCVFIVPKGGAMFGHHDLATRCDARMPSYMAKRYGRKVGRAGVMATGPTM